MKIRVSSPPPEGQSAAAVMDRAEVQPRGAIPHPSSGAATESARLQGTGVAERRYPTPEVRGSGLEELPHIRGAVAVRAQEGREELLHIQGQEGRPYPK